MSENTNQVQIQSQNEPKVVKVFYFMHEDGLESKYKLPLLIKVNGKIYSGFLKFRTNIHASSIDMYYIFSNNIYVKLWSDKVGNILVYFGSVKDVNFFLDGFGEIINIDYADYDEENNVINCNGKRIKLEGFGLVEDLKKLEPELIEPTLAIICTKLVP